MKYTSQNDNDAEVTDYDEQSNKVKMEEIGELLCKAEKLNSKWDKVREYVNSSIAEEEVGEGSNELMDVLIKDRKNNNTGARIKHKPGQPVNRDQR